MCSSLNSPNSGIGLFYADSGFFDGKNRVFDTTDVVCGESDLNFFFCVQSDQGEDTLAAEKGKIKKDQILQSLAARHKFSKVVAEIVLWCFNFFFRELY